MILCLDIDGVLHPMNREKGPLAHVPHFEAVMRDYPDVDIVLSSTWREEHSLKALRALPGDFPSPSTVRDHFDHWPKVPEEGTESLLEQALKNQVAQERENNGRQPSTSFCIMDAQSVKNTDSARHKGHDAGKKVPGIQRHIAVDTQGLPHAIAVTTADVNDRSGALLMFLLNENGLSKVEKVLVDGGYTGERFGNLVFRILGAPVEAAKRNEQHKFAVIPKRWVVERSFAWLEKCRRLWKSCERKLHTGEQFIGLAFLSLLLKRHWALKSASIEAVSRDFDTMTASAKVLIQSPMFFPCITGPLPSDPG